MYSSREISHSKYSMRHGEQRRLGSCENICQNRVWRMFSTSLERLDYSSKHRLVVTWTIPSEYLVDSSPSVLCKYRARWSKSKVKEATGPAGVQVTHSVTTEAPASEVFAMKFLLWVPALPVQSCTRFGPGASETLPGPASRCLFVVSTVLPQSLSSSLYFHIINFHNQVYFHYISPDLLSFFFFFACFIHFHNSSIASYSLSYI